MTSIWTGTRVLLRGIEPDDWQAFMSFDEHSATIRDADMLHPPRSAEGYRQWAQSQATQALESDEFRLAIECTADGALVGSVNTWDSDRRAGRFSYGIAIGHQHQRQGFASDAIVILLRFMFGERRYHKCEAGIYAFNAASLALHRKLGFQKEGQLRDHEFFAGRHHDLVLMGMTAEEFADTHGLPDVGDTRAGTSHRTANEHPVVIRPPF
jgi:RimJ/RimL family protein N-acetyltransferase